MNPDGILLVNKPSGWTSHDIVAKARGILKKELGTKVKVGHTGTLDPLATGLMVVVVGAYCKRASEFSKLDKTYEVCMRLGETSTTGDSEGDITKVNDAIPTKIEISQALSSFVGEIMQTPPIFSAIKVGGKRAYQLAREGKEVKMEPRQVSIFSIKMAGYNYPEVSFSTEVSSGTYIRSLVEDIGRKLGTDAYMNRLKRTRVGNFSIQNSIQVKDCQISKLQK